tara:strand:- start:259 stop:576 length:318 start_codon:yes stop_codon:yes gene_type:complete
MTMPDAILAISTLMGAPKTNITRAVYNIRSFAPTAEEFRQKLMEYFPNANISFNATEKRQQMVDSWPADTNDRLAQIDWKWKPTHDLDSGMKDYLVPELQQMYKN